MAKISQAVKTNLPKDIIKISDEQLERLKNIGGLILGLTAAAGVLTVAVAAPNALQLINKAKWARKTYNNLASRRKEQGRKISQAFYYLKANSYIELYPKGDDFIIKITLKGKEKLLQLNFESLKIAKAPKWDKKWWLVMSDIPTEMRSQADSFRKKIKSMGLMTLQRSVWIYPFDPRDEVAFIAKYYGLDKYVTTMKVDFLEAGDEGTAKHFFKESKLI